MPDAQSSLSAPTDSRPEQVSGIVDLGPANDIKAEPITDAKITSHSAVADLGHEAGRIHIHEDGSTKEPQMPQAGAELVSSLKGPEVPAEAVANAEAGVNDLSPGENHTNAQEHEQENVSAPDKPSIPIDNKSIHGGIERANNNAVPVAELEAKLRS